MSTTERNFHRITGAMVGASLTLLIMPHIVPLPPKPDVFQIDTVLDGEGCVLKPDMIFNKDTGYTTITLVCDTDILYQHLPAVEVVE